MHGEKCQKYNGPHKLEHHRDIAWCCKANFKLRLEKKKRNLVFILSSILTVKTIIRQIVATVHSRNTGLTEISIARSCRSSEKLELTQFAYL